MISSTCWVPRGFASEFPEKYELDDEEMQRIEEMANLNIADAKEDLEEAEAEEGEEGEELEDAPEEKTNSKSLKSEIDMDDDLKEYDLEHYDDEIDQSKGESVGMFPGLSSSAAKYFKGDDDDEEDDDEEGNNGQDYLTLPTETDITEEKAELQVYPTDNMILATRTEDDISYLDVYVYDDGAGAPQGAEEEEGDRLDPDVAKGLVREGNLYVHHDLMLPAFPLCVEWMSFKPNGVNDDSNIGNFAAIGTFDPTIEIWNLDCIDKAFPDVILGENEMLNNKSSGKKKNNKKKKSAHVLTHHTDAVLSLSHNKVFRNVLASTSADATVKLWDLTNCTAVRSMKSIHNAKHVSSSQWYEGFNNSSDNGSMLLTGGYDSFACVSDVRISDENQMSKRWKVQNNEEIEVVKWGNNNNEGLFFAGTDNGNVYCFDARIESKPIWTLHAHDAGISTLEINKFVKGMLVTGAMGEKTVKLWKINEEDSKKGPSMVLSRDFGVGNVLTSNFAPDIEVAGNLVVGGSNTGLKMWDTFSNKYVRSSFKDSLRELQKSAREEAIRLGKSSRIARKYINDNYHDTVLEAERGGAEEEEEDEEDEE
ncbi:hypothetical protein B5S28_g700 [[Candida] boidinii]|nr:hypothetical protein B5S28_g700 [[Candida] boidinii]OWB71245.1 hypothetical protein B5S31_g931 [[Candida] boidinii]OWB77160.1 hypothetical protein B5S32_g1321 [[Candida] boidinii]